MRKMLNTLFVTSEEAYLALENENVVVYRDSEQRGAVSASGAGGHTLFFL